MWPSVMYTVKEATTHEYKLCMTAAGGSQTLKTTSELRHMTPNTLMNQLKGCQGNLSESD